MAKGVKVGPYSGRQEGRVSLRGCSRWRRGAREDTGRGQEAAEGWGQAVPYSLGSFSTCRATEPAS